MKMSVGAETADLAAFGNVVPDGYRYFKKLVAPAPELFLPNACLKWYDIYPAEAAITSEQRADAQAFVEAESQRLAFANELGFVLLHRAGPMLLLLLITWRNTNELWESVYAKEAASQDTYHLVEFETSHCGTYCVWELAPIWHERDAWVRFLSSERDVAAKHAYLNDQFAGTV